MNISANLFSAGLSALNTSQKQLNNAAHAIAQSNHNLSSTAATPAMPTLDIANISEQLMQLEQAKQMSELGARVLNSAEESLGTLIDIQA